MQLIEADWPAPPGVVALTTTRTGGVSRGRYASLNLGDHVGDAPDAVAANRVRLADALRLPSEPRWLAQVHGTRVVRAGGDAFDAGPPEADATVCLRGRQVLAVLTADCLPIVLCDTRGPGIAALHCGWRSLAGGLVDAAIRALGAEPGNLLAWLGPAISQPAFEVGDDVRDAFLAGIEDAAQCFTANAGGRWQADLYGLARLYLERAGVAGIHGGGLCTAGDRERFFSYRRDGQCGRMATLIFRRDA